MAQTTTGSISGVVRDQSGAVIPGANVTVTNVDTGIKRSAASDAEGRYRAPELNPGFYEVQAQAAGFQTEIRRGIQLTVGSAPVINMTLSVGQVEQTTVVTAEAPLVETVTSTVSDLVDDRTIRDLPLNGRSFDQLISLQSSMPLFRNVNKGSTQASALFSVAGSRTFSNVFSMDGAELLGGSTNQTQPGGVLGNNLGVEAVQEFSILSTNYSAAYGKRMGGIVNIATRSGTNQLHGSAFEFLRNDNLDARNFFDPNPQPPEFKRNQFGATLGGPVWRDHSFFFVNYEGLRERLGETNFAVVPDENARRGLLPDPANPGQLRNVGVAPNVRPFLVIYPAPTGPSFGDGTAPSVNNPRLVANQNFELARFDHKISDKDFLFVRQTYSAANSNDPEEISIFSSVADDANHSGVVSWKRVYANFINSFQAGATRTKTNTDSQSNFKLDPSLVFLQGAPTIGRVTFTTNVQLGGTLTTSGTTTSSKRFNAVDQYDFSDQVFYNRGPHALKFGFDFQRIRHNEDFGTTKLGEFTFAAGLQSFLEGRPSRFRAPVPGADATKAYRMNYIATFFQDDFQVRPNLTLNLGLRWEVMTVPREASGNRIANFRAQLINGVPLIDAAPTVGQPHFKSHPKTIAPRFGFAWDPFQDGKTSVRGGAGMYFDQIENEFRFFTANNGPFFQLASITGGRASFPLGFAGLDPSAQAVRADTIDPNIDVPTRLSWNLEIQREVAANTVVHAGYVGSHAYHLTRQSDKNGAVPQILPNGTLFFPANAPRRQLAIAGSRFVTGDANSFYQALQLDLQQRLTRGLRFKASFTVSKNIDEASQLISIQGTGNTNQTLIADDLRNERSLAGFDVRRNLVGNFTYDLPFQNLSGVAGALLGGWQVGSILTISDGFPFTALTGFDSDRNRTDSSSDRPNLVPGRSNNPRLGGPGRFFDPTAFELPPAGFYGNLGRDTLIGPGFANVDFSLVKTTRVNERMRVDFRAEFFNFFNRANFGLPRNRLFESNGRRSGSAGRVTSAATSRQIQFGLKFLF